jgi:hypothetical protein
MLRSDSVINNVFQGNSVQINRKIIGFPLDRTLDNAALWILPSSQADVDLTTADIYVPITTTDSAQFGHINDDGAGKGDGELFFIIPGSPSTAEIDIDPSGVDNTVRFTAVLAGQLENNISIEYVDPAAPSISLSVSTDLDTKTITITLATDGGSLITSTAADIIALVNGDPDASSLVTASPIGTVTGVVTAISPTNLAGGNNSTAELDPNDNQPFLMHVYLDNGNIHYVEQGTIRVIDPNNPTPPTTADATNARAARTTSTRLNNIINSYMDAVLHSFRELRVWDEHARRMGDDPLSLMACYRPWNFAYQPEVYDANNNRIEPSNVTFDYDNAVFRVNSDTGYNDYFVTYEFDYFPVNELIPLVNLTLAELNVAGASDGGHVTNYGSVDETPEYWDGPIAIGALAKAFQRLATDSGLWKNYLIWADPEGAGTGGEMGQQLAQNARDYFTDLWLNLSVSLKRVHLIASPTGAYEQFSSIGFGFFATEGSKFRGLQVNKLSTF